jgi:DNA polymerase III epsilon subunit-like protein
MKGLKKLGDFKQPQSDMITALLALPNLTFLILDTTGVASDADIVRVLIADRTGQVLYDQVIQPQRGDDPNTPYTGITFEEILCAPTLDECWEDIEAFVEGSVIAAFNLNFVVERLRENATHYKLPTIIPMIGVCLQKHAQIYFSESRSLSLSSACDRIGHTLPRPAFAHDKLAGQLALLKAMSTAKPIAVESDDNPF